MIKKITYIALFTVFASFQSKAGLINVNYNGSFDESSIASEGGLPAGDYDTVGGLNDVAVFQLVEGTNEFFGSVYSPQDGSDVFTVEVMSGFRLVGASINWATNLPGIPLDFNNPAGYLGQNTWGNAAPDWFFEESSITPEIFTINNLEASAVGFNFDIAPSFYTADSFVRGAGIYSSTLAAQGSCAQSYSGAPGGIGLIANCADALDYKMSFIVEKIQPVTSVPEPTSLAILTLGLMGFTLRKLNK